MQSVHKFKINANLNWGAARRDGGFAFDEPAEASDIPGIGFAVAWMFLRTSLARERSALEGKETRKQDRLSPSSCIPSFSGDVEGLREQQF
jgi:hypothetical protein